MRLKIIENFLNTEDLDGLCSLDIKPVGPNEIKVYQNIITGDQVSRNDCIDLKLLKDMNDRYHNLAMKILRELNPKKVSLYDYSEFYIIETGSNYKFPIHDDIPNKILSGVVYLKPEKNSGTLFYKNKKGEGKEEVEWKVNKAVFFSRAEKETWHSYQGDGKSNRLVLVYNLMTSKLKDVYKIEGKSYYLGIFRFKINYYLHKYFKFTI
ncbi:hypothetical protein OAL70_04640 [Pelagibacteraceae bacterium]|nr:hypothetical protein [Pelagibacteraceae bacterium]|tara:strand:+ start:383 stop:1009 length:627 start_codon:yes stop_codon:yes gene_type:complete